MLRVLMLLAVLLCALGPAWVQPELVPTAVQDEKDLVRLVEMLDVGTVIDADRIEAARRLSQFNAPETVPALMAAMADPTFGVRKYAARALGLIGNPVAVPVLIQHVAEVDPEVRLEVIIALGRLHDPRAVPAVIAAVNDTEDRIQLEAVIALGRIDTSESTEALRDVAAEEGDSLSSLALLALGRRKDRTITPLCLTRASRPGFNDLFIAHTLAELGDPAAIPVLTRLADHPNIEIRRDACLGLARIGTDPAVVALLEVLDRRSRSNRDAREVTEVWRIALRALPTPKAHAHLPAWIKSLANSSLRDQAMEVLAFRYDVDLDELGGVQNGNTALYWGMRNWLDIRQPGEYADVLRKSGNLDILSTLANQRRWRDSEQLDGLLGPTLTPPIAFVIPLPERGAWVTDNALTKQLLDSNNGMVNPYIIFLAGYTGDHAAGLSMRKYLYNGSESTNIDACARGLGELGDACAIPDLFSVLNTPGHDEDYGLRLGVSGCADARHTASYLVLLQQLNAKQKEVRKTAIAGLGSSHDARAVPALIALMQKDPEADVREFCALALGLIGDTRALGPLYNALHDPVEWARSAAAWALGMIGDPRAIDPLREAELADRDQRFVVRAAWSLYRLGERDAAEKLSELLTSTDDNNRRVSSRALQECDESSIAGSLLARLAETPDTFIIRALGCLRSEQAIGQLVTVLTEPTYNTLGNQGRLDAAWGLGRIAEGREGQMIALARETLYRTAMRDADPQVRATAALGLARAGDPRAVALLEWVLREYVPERNAAIRMLWRFPEGHVTDLLVELLQDDDPLGQVLAARGLYLRNHPDGATALRKLVQTVTEPVALQVAIRFAGELKDPSLVPTFARLAKAQHDEAKIFLVLEAIDALGKIDSPEATSVLVGRLLNSPAAQIREAAARALTGTQDPTARNSLRTCLAKEEATRVKAAITRALGEGTGK